MTGVTSFPVTFAVEHDQEASTVAIIAFAGEQRFVVETAIVLRAEHNNPIDALRIMMDRNIFDQEDYERIGVTS